jgi:hypothetical protein
MYRINIFGQPTKVSAACYEFYAAILQLQYLTNSSIICLVKGEDKVFSEHAMKA